MSSSSPPSTPPPPSPTHQIPALALVLLWWYFCSPIYLAHSVWPRKDKLTTNRTAEHCIIKSCVSYMLGAIRLGQYEVAETCGTRGKVRSAYSILGWKLCRKRLPRRSRKRWVDDNKSGLTKNYVWCHLSQCSV